MKRFVERFFVQFCVAFGVVCLFLTAPQVITGCAKKPTTNALNASKVTHVGVTTGVRAWEAYVKQQDAEITVSQTLTNAADIKATKERKAKLVKEARQVRDSYNAYREANKASALIIGQLIDVTLDGTNAPVVQDKLDKSREKVREAMVEVAKTLAEKNIEVK